MENTEHTKYTRFMLFILAIVLLTASIIGYFVSKQINNNTGGVATNYVLRPTNSPIPTLIPYPVNGTMSLSHTKGVLQVGEPITLSVIATSGDDDVAGYDVVLTYDTALFKQEAVSDESEIFQIFTYTRPTHLAVSATKDLSVVKQIRFTNTPILSFTFIPKKKGSYIFSLKPVGNESSKFVNEAAAVVYPETTDIRLEIN